MKRLFIYIPIALLFALSFTDCAKKGRPTGGLRDSLPPVIVRSVPENYTTNFSQDEIRIYFDEYIKLNEIQKNLIISPPLKYQPVITPLSTSKILKIKILDTLRENTTYSFNFGRSIVDNNEGNEFEYFKYVFSTGPFIDSLKLRGTIRDAELSKPEGVTTVMLYDINETFTDSIVFSEKPTYITTTQDSTNTFELSNLREGKYLLLALKDSNNDYIFQPSSDRIGFVKAYITIPTDSLYELTLFKEFPTYRMDRAKQISKNEIQFGYEGNADSLQLELFSNTPSGFTSKSYKDIKRDTLHYWYKPALEVDSLLFIAKNKTQVDTLNVRMKELYRDTLKIEAINAGLMTLKDTLQLKANVPLISITSENIKIINRDSISVESTSSINLKNNTISVVFPKTEGQTYMIQALPGFATDFFEETNDTLNYNVRTKANSDYGTLSLTLANVEQYPVIVQLTNSKFEVKKEKRVYNADTTIDFDFIDPAKYYIRVIYDENSNGIWDPGNFLAKRQPEKIVYYPSVLDVKSNWSLIETFTLGQSGPGPVETAVDPEE